MSSRTVKIVCLHGKVYSSDEEINAVMICVKSLFQTSEAMESLGFEAIVALLTIATKII
jgi:hypothetical protein